MREYGGGRNTEYGNTHEAYARGVHVSTHTAVFCARATSGAAETAFPLRTAIEKHSFGLLSSSSIHWCKVCLVDDFHDPGFWGTLWHIEMLRVE
eukprot:6543936-Prymnesium_polylepis.1